MAVQTQLILSGLRQQFVAIGAIALELGMPLDQRAGHDQSLERILRKATITATEQRQQRQTGRKNHGPPALHVEPCLPGAAS